MYQARNSYEENYRTGPHAGERSFPMVSFKGDAQFSFLGHSLHLPFGIPAGPLLNARFVNAALKAGFCSPVYKTVRSVAWQCHPYPNILSIDTQQRSLFASRDNVVVGREFRSEDTLASRLSISNSFGVPSQPVSVWSEDVLRISSSPGQLPMLSFQGSRWGEGADPVSELQRDTARTAKLAAEAALRAGIHVLEMNLSCPNEAGAPVYTEVNVSRQLVKAACRAIRAVCPKLKLVLKIGVLSLEESKRFLSAVAETADGVSAINTVSSRILDKNGNIILGSGMDRGGICGSLILEQGLRCVENMAKARAALGLQAASFGLIGVGGVFTARDFTRYRNVGADMVQAATGAMWNLGLASEVATACEVPHSVAFN